MEIAFVKKLFNMRKKQAVRVVVNSILWRIAIEKRGRMCDCCILNLSERYTSVLVNSIVHIRNNGLPGLLRNWHIRAWETSNRYKLLQIRRRRFQ